MEKLIKLVCEYDRFKEGISVGRCITTGDFDNKFYRLYIVSKEYGFIKRLVNNDKIKKEGGICPRKDLVQETIIRDRETNEAIGWENKYTEEEQLLMYLSIQENPIDFLCGILKQ